MFYVRRTLSPIFVALALYLFSKSVASVFFVDQLEDRTGVLSNFTCQDKKMGGSYVIEFVDEAGVLRKIVSAGVSCRKLQLLESSSGREIRVKYNSNTKAIRILELSGTVLISELGSLLSLLAGTVIWGGVVLYTGIILWPKKEK